MRIRTQTVLVITPIFMALGVAIGCLVYASERSEIMWALESEVTSLAGPIAEFIDSDDLDAAKKPVESILSYDQLKRARLIRADGSEVWEIGDIPGESIITAQAPVHNASGDVVATLEVTIDASWLGDRTQRIFVRCVFIITALTALGVLLSFVIARFLTRKLGRLDAAARIVAAGDYNQKIAPTRIHEVNDLGSTFNTMSSILKDLLSKAKKELVESEQFRNPADLAATSRQLEPCAVRREIGEFEVILRTAGELPSGDFAGIYESDDTLFFLLGSTTSEDPLDATVTANAALFLLQQLLKKHSPDVVIERVTSVFELEQLLILEHRGNATFQIHGTGCSLELKGDTLDCSSQTPIAITTAKTATAEKIDKFLAAVGNLSERELDILTVGEPIAAFLVVQNRQDSGAKG